MTVPACPIAAEAHTAVDTAAAKLHAAFNAMLDGAEKIETPKVSTERDRPNYLADRADRWCSAMANRAAAQQATLEKLTASATAAWPGIAGILKA